MFRRYVPAKIRCFTANVRRSEAQTALRCTRYTTKNRLLNLAPSSISGDKYYPFFHRRPIQSSFLSNRSYTTMASSLGKAPYFSQDVEEVQSMIKKLTEARNAPKHGKKSFSCRKTSFTVVREPENLTIDSWRFHDWDYKLPNLPTYARGLFTGKNENNLDEIVTRGYDKFFNVEEVAATKWPFIESNTKGPYEVSVKENGCIIFISGLRDNSLLVCSKHSTGSRSDGMSHSAAGEKWIENQLTALGSTREHLAKELRSRNATAVAELCDDSFEEHILPYEKEKAGLYLHGININIPRFVTYSGDQVQDFADRWGFRKTDFLVLDDVKKTKRFLDDVFGTGSYNGRDIEGFVIRCKARKDEESLYEDWFFKYKFEEPYLMYRQWRECTKALISGKTPRYNKHVEITKEYLTFAKKRLSGNPSLEKAYLNNHGIISLRNEFLREKNLKGSDIIRQENADSEGVRQDEFRGIILVPIATIGCGKTTIGVALRKLFGWGHVQNDNIVGKGRPARFTKEVLTQLETAPVVFADRNNARRHERTQIIDDVRRSNSNVRLVALHFVHEKGSIDEIRKITQGRVIARGDNHQTIQAATAEQKAIGIMEGFISGFCPLDYHSAPDNGFEAVIDLDPTFSSRENLETVVSELNRLFPKLLPRKCTTQDFDNAIYYALNDYKSTVRHEIVYPAQNPRNEIQKNNQQTPAAKSKVNSKAKAKAIEYFSVTLDHSQLTKIIEETFSPLSPEYAHFWEQLKGTNRIQSEFHVTLIHRASAKAHPLLWKRYSEAYAKACGDSFHSGQEMGSCRVLLERIVWDHRLMAIVVRLVDEGWDYVNQIAHITLGTRGNDVKPKESNDLLKQWIVTGSGDESGIKEALIQGHKVINGSVIGTLSR